MFSGARFRDDSAVEGDADLRNSLRVPRKCRLLDRFSNPSFELTDSAE